MTTRETLYRLVDSIPASQLDDSRKVLEPLTDPTLTALADAPLDDEPESDEELALVAEGRAALVAGDSFSLEQVRRELGL